MTYATSLAAALRTAVVRTAAPKAAGKSGKSKKRSKAHTTDEAAAAPAPAAIEPAKPKEPSWGLLDPLRSMLPSPLVSLLDLLFTTQNLIFIMGALLIYTWFFRVPTAALAPGHAPLTALQRQIAYEHIWRAEEAELWNWLEERVALDRVHGAVASGRVLQGQDLQSKLVAEGLREKQVDEAIRVTEERLSALKGAVERERESGAAASVREDAKAKST